MPAQFPLARAFFKAVTQGEGVSGEFSGEGTPHPCNDVIVTGHSLGRELVDYIDARVDVKSFLVEPIPYAVNDNGFARMAA